MDFKEGRTFHGPVSMYFLRHKTTKETVKRYFCSRMLHLLQ